MSNIDITALMELLKSWQSIKDLTPSSSTIFVGERQGILQCASQLEEVLKGMEADALDMDPYNTSGDRPTGVSK